MMDSEHRNTENLINATNFLGLIATETNLPWKCNAYVYMKRMLIAFIVLLQDYQSNMPQLQEEFHFGVTWLEQCLFAVSYIECTNTHDLKTSAEKISTSYAV